MKVGPYQLLEVVGTGGMGTVYRAQDATTGQVVAVKLLAVETATDARLRSRVERNCLDASRLRHPNLTRGLGFFVDGRRPYLVSEYLSGQSLLQRIKQQGPLPEGNAVQTARQIAEALDLAHRHDLTHGGVKPNSILLTENDQAKLTSLGLARGLDVSVTLGRSATEMGSVAFMAPEQFGDARLADARSDVYGLAATLYYALTGAVPFQAPGLLAVLKKKLEYDFIPLRRLTESLPPRIDQAVSLALNPSPEKRPASCQEFASLLTADRSGKESRRAERFASVRQGCCRAWLGGDYFWRVELQDVSTTGLRLRMDRRFEPGSTLRVEVPDPWTGACPTWLVSVRWVKEVGADHWSAGCAFARPLSEGELDTFLAGDATAPPPPKPLGPHSFSSLSLGDFAGKGGKSKIMVLSPEQRQALASA